MRPAPATHGRHTSPQPPLKGEGDRGAVEGSLCKGAVEGFPSKTHPTSASPERGGGPRSGGGVPPEKHTPTQPPLKGEGDHEVVEGFL